VATLVPEPKTNDWQASIAHRLTFHRLAAILPLYGRKRTDIWDTTRRLKHPTSNGARASADPADGRENLEVQMKQHSGNSSKPLSLVRFLHSRYRLGDRESQHSLATVCSVPIGLGSFPSWCGQMNTAMLWSVLWCTTI
jgi:hypothetical protein